MNSSPIKEPIISPVKKHINIIKEIQFLKDSVDISDIYINDNVKFVSAAKERHTKPMIAKIKLKEEITNKAPVQPIIMEIRNIFLLPYLSEKELPTKYNVPPAKMTMNIDRFLYIFLSQYNSNLLTNENLSL